MAQTVSVAKEEINALHVHHDEVLKETIAIQQRQSKLQQAMWLGNIHKGKVTLVFDAEEGQRSVETTIWAATDQHVVLKGGVILPIACILDVLL